jgi:DNA repair protein RecN (Recombination protein N)
MIKSLYIKNYALIGELEVHFEQGLNILTGQTGAGKSIILDAVNLILGERADTTVIRQGADKAVAEGIIAAGKNDLIRQILEKNDIENHEELIMRREIRSSGSRAFINDTPVTISLLKKVGNFLVDLHGQHDHQLLLKEENHRTVLDGFGDIADSLKTYRERYFKMKDLRQKRKRLLRKHREMKEKRELHRFQLRELEDAELKTGEEAELEEEINLLNNAEERAEKTAKIVNLAAGEESGVIPFLNSLKLHLEDMVRIDPDFESYLDEVSSARISVQEMLNFTERYQAGIEINPQWLKKLRKRQSELNRLQKKYNRPVPELLDYLREIREELNAADNFDLTIKKFDAQINHQSGQLAAAAHKLHQKRMEMGRFLAESVEDELRRLGIVHADFEVNPSWLTDENGWVTVDGRPVECTPQGCDDIRFYLSTNKGEDPKPLADIASGGEISRVMLALKSTLARQERLPVMIFDEIDSGISGKISEKVGRTMRRLSKQCQIIAITHQPQIAGQAHAHYKVSKTEQEGRIMTRITSLTNREHIREVASLMSGEDITAAALQSAEELIGKNTFKN